MENNFTDENQKDESQYTSNNQNKNISKNIIVNTSNNNFTINNNNNSNILIQDDYNEFHSKVEEYSPKKNPLKTHCFKRICRELLSRFEMGISSLPTCPGGGTVNQDLRLSRRS